MKANRIIPVCLCLLFLLSAVPLHAGTPADFWLFGNVFFHFEPDGSRNTKSCAEDLPFLSAYTIASPEGAPLLFGAGDHLYKYNSNGAHALITDKLDVESVTQAAAFLPVRGETGKYKLVYLSLSGLRSATCDTTQETADAILGDFDTLVPDTHWGTALTLVDHADKRKAWIISYLKTPQIGPDGKTQAFEVCLYDGKEISRQEVDVPEPTVHTPSTYSNFVVSPNGKYLAYGYNKAATTADGTSNTTFGMALYNFDNQTGVIRFNENIVVASIEGFETGDQNKTGGVAFSADGHFAYLGVRVKGETQFYQIDLTPLDPGTPKAARVREMIDPKLGNVSVGAGQLAPDGNIYYCYAKRMMLCTITAPSKLYTGDENGARVTLEDLPELTLPRAGLPLFNQGLVLNQLVTIERDNSLAIVTCDPTLVAPSPHIEEFGICWGKTETPTATKENKLRATDTEAPLVCDLNTHLTPGTKYTLRSYAIIDGDTKYYDTLTLTLSDPPPINTADSDTSAKPGTTVTLRVADVSGCTCHWVQTQGPAVTLDTPDQPTTRFTMPDAPKVSFRVTLCKNDGTSASKDVTVITWPQAVIETPADVSNAGSVTLSARPGEGYAYRWEQVDGPGVSLTDADAPNAAFDASALADGTALTFKLTVTNTNGVTATIDKTITVRNPPSVDISGIAPKAKAGATVALATPEQPGCTYTWTQTGGTPVSLTDADRATATFSMPEGAEGLTFWVTATDAYGIRTEQGVSVREDTRPMASAGPSQTVREGDRVVLDATGSADPDGDPLTFTWKQTAGPDVGLSSAHGATPAFIAPNVLSGGGAVTFALTATDPGGQQDTDSVIINVSFLNEPPVADAGPDCQTLTGARVHLSGANSFEPDDGALTYAWAQTDGTPVTLTGAHGATPSFTAPATSGALTFRLTVTDPQGLKGNDEVICNVKINAADRLAPMADAGPDATVAFGAPVTLNGFNSHARGHGNHLARYEWKQLSGPGVTLCRPTSARTRFIAPAAGGPTAKLTFRLRVTDQNGLAASDLVIINVTADGVAPSANAGVDQTVAKGAPVTLDGSASSDQGAPPAAYRWQQIAGLPVTLKDARTATPTFTAPNLASGGEALMFRLFVTSRKGLTDCDTVIVNIDGEGALTMPRAVATNDAQGSALEGTTVTLNGSASSAAAPAELTTYSWRQVAGPMAPLSDPGAVAPTFVCPASPAALSTVTFELTVRDSNGLESTARVSVDVTARTDFDDIDDERIEFTAFDDRHLGIVPKEPGGGARTTAGEIVTLKPVDPFSLDAPGDAPRELSYGLIDFAVRVEKTGGTTEIEVQLPAPAPTGCGWVKFRPASNAWVDFTDHARFSADRKTVTLTLTDGGPGDDDGLANGIIKDPSGPGVITDAGADDDDAYGPCFIGTAKR